MLKKVFLAAAVSLIMAGATMTVSSASASHSCNQVAGRTRRRALTRRGTPAVRGARAR